MDALDSLALTRPDPEVLWDLAYLSRNLATISKSWAATGLYPRNINDGYMARLPSDPESRILALETIAVFQRDAAHYDYADETFSLALKEAKIVHGENSFRAGVIHGEYGQLFLRTRQAGSAYDHLWNAHRIISGLKNSKNALIEGLFLNSMGLAAAADGNLRLAKRHLSEAAALYRKTDIPELAIAVGNLGLIQKDLGEAQALTNILHGINRLSTVVPPGNIALLNLRLSYARVLREIGDPTGGLVEASECLMHAQNTLGPTHLLVGTCRRECGLCQLRLGLKESAVSSFSAACNVLENYGDTEHAVLNELNELFYEITFDA